MGWRRNDVDSQLSSKPGWRWRRSAGTAPSRRSRPSTKFIRIRSAAGAVSSGRARGTVRRVRQARPYRAGGTHPRPPCQDRRVDRVSARVGGRLRGAARDRGVDGVLQRGPPPLGAGRADACGGVLRRGGTGRACGVARWGGCKLQAPGTGASGCTTRSGSCPHIHKDRHPPPRTRPPGVPIICRGVPRYAPGLGGLWIGERDVRFPALPSVPGAAMLPAHMPIPLRCR